MSARGTVAAVALALVLLPLPAALGEGRGEGQVQGEGQRDQHVHGVADAFARTGVALAWGILRGKSEADTIVIVRVETSAPEFAFVAADGVDPFTQQRKALQGPTRASTGVDLRFPRAHFADFPRTEFKFAADDKGSSPTLTVYYLGVPDTTPEFPTPDALGRYLVDRLARERAVSGRAPK